MARTAVGCLILSLHFFDSDTITEWPASTSFPGCAIALAFRCPQSRGNYFDFPALFHIQSYIFVKENDGVVEMGTGLREPH